MSAGRYSNTRLILRMLALAWRFKRKAIIVIGLQVILLALALSGLGFTGLGIDVLKQQVFPEQTIDIRWPLGIAPPADWSTLGVVAAISGLILAIATLRMLLDRTSVVATGRLVQDIVVDLRHAVFDKLERLSFRFFDANESGSIINRVTGDVQAVRMFVDQVLITVLMMVLSLTFFLVYMLSIHVTLTIVCLLTTPLLWFLAAWFSRRVRPAYIRNRELFDKAVLSLSENVQGHHVVKGFSLQDQQQRVFASANDAVTAQQRWIFWQVSIFVPIIQLLPTINLMLLLTYGGWLYMQDQIEFGQGLIVFAGLLTQFSAQVGNIAQIANAVQRSLTGAQRVFEVLDQPLDVTSPENAVPLPRARGAVKFESVTFAYEGHEDEPALKDVSLDVEAGQTIAILGATGSGKSTLLSLIPRFYDPIVGRITIDGTDLREYDLDDLRRNIGVVFQESFLFSHTVHQNIAFGHPSATREQVENAAKIAAAHHFILEDLAKGYDTLLTEAGGNLSGGQRQRLAIARAVLLEPPILLMDDPTAAIDPETEHEILQAMDQAMAGRTTFVVAHRLSTLRRADQVVVLEEGRVVQVGTHESLLRTGGHYRKAAKLQLADAESRQLLGLGEAHALPRIEPTVIEPELDEDEEDLL
jgi:ATP-binding cassette subfamily B protein